jgi:hypothetical protein
VFLDEATAQSRIEGSRNILTRINRDESPVESYPVSLPSIQDSAELDDCPEHEEEDGDPTETVVSEIARALEPVKAPKVRMDDRGMAEVALVGQVLGRRISGNVFDRSGGHINNLQNAVTRHDRDVKQSLFAMIEEGKSEIRGKAQEKLTQVLDLMTIEKLRRVEKPRELSSIAVQLSQVLERTLPKELTKDDGVHFHIYRPEIRTEETYNIVEVG